MRLRILVRKTVLLSTGAAVAGGVIGWRFFRNEDLSMCRKVEQLDKRPVLLTGCDTGLGREAVLRLAALQLPVYAACLTHKAVEELNKESDENYGGRILALQCDVTDVESIESVYKVVSDKEKDGLWALINNAGISPPNMPLDWLRDEDFERTLDINLMGTVRFCRRFGPLIKRRKGRIVNVTSLLGRTAKGLYAPYCASKFATEAFSDVLREEMSSFGVSVHIIEPGAFGTAALADETVYAKYRQRFNSLPQEIRDEYGEKYVDELCTDRELDSTYVTKDIKPAVDAYVDAAVGLRPRLRYTPGDFFAKIFLLLSILPTNWGDWVKAYLNEKKGTTPNRHPKHSKQM